MPPTTPPGRTANPGWKVVGRAKGVMMMATLLIMVVAALFVAPLLAGTLRDNGIKPSGVAALFLSAPWLVLPLSIPAFAACWPLVKGTERPIWWMTVSTLLALLPLGFFLYGAVGAIAELYTAAFNF
ncbi:MAG: hypothetical protein ACO3IB_10810 [Phycisphaerales bacterium]